MPIPLSDWATLKTVNSSAPGTVTAAATIAPTTFLTVLTGATPIATITPPVPHTHMLALQFPGTGGLLATGNILTAVTSVAGQITLLVYNTNSAKYVPVG